MGGTNWREQRNCGGRTWITDVFSLSVADRDMRRRAMHKCVLKSSRTLALFFLGKSYTLLLFREVPRSVFDPNDWLKSSRTLAFLSREKGPCSFFFLLRKVPRPMSNQRRSYFHFFLFLIQGNREGPRRGCVVYAKSSKRSDCLFCFFLIQWKRRVLVEHAWHRRAHLMFFLRTHLTFLIQEKLRES